VHTFLDNVLLIAGGAIDSATPWIYCIGQGPCPNKDQDCSNYCLKSKFPKGGKCIASQCCCSG